MGKLKALSAATSKMPVKDFSYKAILKTLMPLKVQYPLPTIGLELYQLGYILGQKKQIKKNEEVKSFWHSMFLA